MNFEEKDLRTEEKEKEGRSSKLCDAWEHPYQLISLDPRGLVDHLLELHRGVYLEKGERERDRERDRERVRRERERERERE